MFMTCWEWLVCYVLYEDGVDVQLDGGSSLSILNGGKSARLPAQSGIYFPIGKYRYVTVQNACVS